MQGPVVQPFAYDESHPYASGQHRGIDIGADAAGETVVAPASGTVSFAGFVPTNGKSVTIETADGYSVTLTHLGSIEVAKGATVAEQDAVGTVGPSGTPEEDGPYVHLGIRVSADPNGYVDPLGLLPPASGVGSAEDDQPASQPSSSGAAAAVPARKPASRAPEKPRVKVTVPEPRPGSPGPTRAGAARRRSDDLDAPLCADAARSRERADELLPAARRRAGGSRADRSRRRPRDPADRVRRAASTRAVQPATGARVQQRRSPVRARPGACSGSARAARAGGPGRLRAGSPPGAAAPPAPAVLARRVTRSESVRMIWSLVGSASEDPRLGRLAVRERPAASRPCRRPRRAVGRVRALSPAQGQRRPHGQRYGRARHAGDGLGRPRGRDPA